MSAAPDPLDPALVRPKPELSEVAQLARDRLHEEIERVRLGVEEMIDEQEIEEGEKEDLRRELDKLRVEARDFVKKRVRKSEKRLEKSVREIGARSDALERRIDEVERDHEAVEARIHNDTERMLDRLLQEMRSIADRLDGLPQPAHPGPAAPSRSAQPKPDREEEGSSKPLMRRPRPFRK